MPQYSKEIITYNSVDYEIKYGSLGWSNNGFIGKRHEFYHGMRIGFSVNGIRICKLNGVYDIVKGALEDGGINTRVDYKYYVRNAETDGFELLYTGMLDFQTYSEETIKNTKIIDIKVKPVSKEASFYDNDEIVYDAGSNVATNGNSVPSFPSGGLEDVEFTGIDLFNFGYTFYESGFVLNSGGTGFPNVASVKKSWSTFSEVQNSIGDSFNRPNNNVNDLLMFTQNNDEPLRVNLLFDYEYSFSLNQNIDLSGSGQQYFDQTYNYRILLKYTSPNGQVISSYVIKKSKRIFNRFDNPDQTFNDSGSGSYSVVFTDVLSGSTFDLYAEILLTGTDSNGISRVNPVKYRAQLNSAIVDLKLTTQLESIGNSTQKSILPHELAAKLTQLQTGEPDVSKLIYSDVFGRTDSYPLTYPQDGEASLNAIARGFMLRSFPSAKMLTSFRSFFDFFDKVYCLGLWYDHANDRIRIEKRSFFYQDVEILRFEQTKNFKRYVDDKAFFNQIKSGYEEKGEYDEVEGGTGAFNVQSEHDINLNVKNALDLRPADYRADSLAIELPRRKQYASFSNIDTKYDDSVMVANIKRKTGGFITETGADVSVKDASFLGAEQRYNYRINARENIKRNIELKAALNKTTEQIRSLNNVKDVDFTYNIGGEKKLSDPVTQAELATNVYLPHKIEFSAVVTTSQLLSLFANPHGFVTCFDKDDIEYSGHIDEFEVNPRAKEIKLTLKEKS